MCIDSFQSMHVLPFYLRDPNPELDFQLNEDNETIDLCYLHWKNSQVLPILFGDGPMPGPITSHVFLYDKFHSNYNIYWKFCFFLNQNSSNIIYNKNVEILLWDIVSHFSCLQRWYFQYLVTRWWWHPWTYYCTSCWIFGEPDILIRKG